MYKYIEPEVAGGLGKETILDNSIHPPRVTKLHYEFDGWLGDDLIESFPCYIVTEPLKEQIEKRGLSGVAFENVIITKSDNFNFLYPERQLPKFYWLKVKANNLYSDFSLGLDFRLVISEAAFNVLNQFNIKNAIIESIE
jgi:hypothetical protein